ncbi:MAG: prolyl oligopeptidase family serine peptidase [Methanobacterium sp.]
MDSIITRKEVDEDKLVLVGYSLGGYFVSEAVIHEKRIRACVADSPIVDIAEYYQGMDGNAGYRMKKIIPMYSRSIPWHVGPLNP